MFDEQLESALAISNEIDGWLTQDECVFLFNSAKEVPNDASILEIGAWKGRSSVLLGLGARAGNQARVFSIDPHTGSPEHKERYGEVDTLAEWKSNVESAGLTKTVTPQVMTSKEASYLLKRKIGMVFIDGNHNYDMVKLDFETWFPRLMDGGLIAMHDTMGKPGPKKVANKQLLRSRQTWKAGFVDTITYAYKVHYNERLDLFHNLWVKYRRDRAEARYNRQKGRAP